MDVESFRNYCLAKHSVTESMPFGPNVLVFKVANKMFALCNVEVYASVNLKCDPERAVQLREEYEAIEPGYHMNKKHWNTVSVDMDVDDKMLKGLIDHSYELIVKSLPKKVRETLQ